jgi:hypothetical protein
MHFANVTLLDDFLLLPGNQGAKVLQELFVLYRVLQRAALHRHETRWN